MAAKKLFTQIFIYFSKPLRLLYFTQIFIYFSKPLRLLYSLIIYEIVNFSFFTLYSLLLLSFFLYLKSVPIYVIVHVHVLCRRDHKSSLQCLQFIATHLQLLEPKVRVTVVTATPAVC